MLRSLLLASMFAATAAAQCATLSVTGTGAPGTAITISIDGTTANAIAFVAIGDTQGSTSIPLGPLGTLSLGLAMPFIPAPLVSTDSMIAPTDPWLAPGSTVTTGNNTEAYLDISGSDGFTTGDVRGVATSAHTFDVQYGLVKAASFGTAVTWIGCMQGMAARGGAQGVGRAATAAVVYSAVMILVLDAFWAVVWLLGHKP